MIGLCLSPVGVYSAEIGLPRIRGRLILGTSIGIAAGILFMYIVGYFIRVSEWCRSNTLRNLALSFPEQLAVDRYNIDCFSNYCHIMCLTYAGDA